MGIDMAVYGYARVSTDGQSLAAQLAELKAAKCEKIFQEKISGARSDRKQLLRLMGLLAKGDVLVVTRLDRLARSTRDLLNLLGTIAEKGAGLSRILQFSRHCPDLHNRSQVIQPLSDLAKIPGRTLVSALVFRLWVGMRRPKAWPKAYSTFSFG